MGPGYLEEESCSFLSPICLCLVSAALADVNVALRKIANLLKPDKEIVQEGDHMIIRTLSTFRNYIMDFEVGKEFEEDLTGIDDRKCMVRTWEPCPGHLTQRGGRRGGGGSKGLVFSGTVDFPTPSPQGGQHSLIKLQPGASKPDSTVVKAAACCLHGLQTLSQGL